MIWVKIYFFLRVMGIALVAALVVGALGYGIYNDFIKRSYKKCTLKVDGKDVEFWFVESERTSGSVKVVLYGPGFPRRKAISKPFIIGTLSYPIREIEMKQTKGEVEWI